ncbi:fructoselysine 6-kinase [uncultured Eudoraea sp.]|uniref:fructoselysine 6-kinase n=1 Tax=uncultured Eudoraea sp. TaxID=1035614 RepID=UPI002608553F|nr:fructoselysine 6-kinase [uncultured Eudoraea sp.]
MMGDSAMKVIGIGDNVVDDYSHIRTMFPGGNALNFSVYASMLGCDSAYLGIFGSDESAKHVQRTLARIGVDTSHCRCVEGPNGHAILTIEDGERVFISSNKGGISKSVPMEFIFDDLDYLQTFSIVHTSAYSYMDRYLSQLQQLNPLISYDFSDDFDSEYALSLCQYIDFGFFSCAEWTEEAAKELLEKAVNKGCTLAVATRGPREVILFDGRSWFRQAPRVVIPKDTLGAGDAFISGFLISYVGGKANTGVQPALLIENSLEKAASFAAEICRVQGAFGHGLRY